MTSIKQNSELLLERRGSPGNIFEYPDFRAVRRGKRFGKCIKMRFLHSVFVLAVLFLIYSATVSFKVLFHVNINMNSLTSQEAQQKSSNVVKAPEYPSCKVDFLESVNDLVEPKDYLNFTRLSLEYIDNEDVSFGTKMYKPRFGGHQTFQEREKSFYASDQTLHCGFVNAPPGFSSTGFDLDGKDKTFMSTCKVAVSTCIFGSSDFLRMPGKKVISDFSRKNVCFVMFVDEETLTALSSDGNNPDDGGYIGLWRIVIVRNLPYEDMRKNGKVPKFLAHRLFPSSRYSLWIDSKVRLMVDPMLIIEYFLWRNRSEFAISNHYVRHCVWEEAARNKVLKKYNATAIDELLTFYQSDGLTKFDPSNPNNLLPSYVPEASFIIRAHTPMSNFFSCLWFNEVDRFTSRDQLSFAYTYLKLKRMNPNIPFYFSMFQDCERRFMIKLLGHRSPPAVSR